MIKKLIEEMFEKCDLCKDKGILRPEDIPDSGITETIECDRCGGEKIVLSLQGEWLMGVINKWLHKMNLNWN